MVFVFWIVLTFTLLCTLYHHSCLELFSPCHTDTLYLLNSNPISLSPQRLATTVLLSVSVNLTTLGTSYKWNHVVFASLCLGLSALLEGLMLKLKLQYFVHLMQRADSLVKTLMMGKYERRKRRGRQTWNCWMASSTQWTWVWANYGRSWGQGSLTCCSEWHCKEWDMP